jgi:hypothetical protein
MNESQEQIAREAANEIRNYFNDVEMGERRMESVESFILSAIERATEANQPEANTTAELSEQHTRRVHKEDRQRQLPPGGGGGTGMNPSEINRSEQQEEWTVAKIRSFRNYTSEVRDEKLAEAINAALAAASEAEDRRLEDLAIEIVELREEVARLNDKLKRVRHDREGLTQQLAAERQRSEQAEERARVWQECSFENASGTITNLKQQLLSAQAARKPLVEALRTIADADPSKVGQSQYKIIAVETLRRLDTALAQCISEPE